MNLVICQLTKDCINIICFFPQMSGNTGSKQAGQTNGKGEKFRKRKTHTIEPQAAQMPCVIPSQSLLSQTSLLHVHETFLPQPTPEVNLPQPSIRANRPQPHNTVSQPQSNQSQPINTVTQPHMSSPTNVTPATSCSAVGGGNDNGNDDGRMWIVPEEDGFDPHKPVIEGIASCIRSKFELAKPSWKKFPQSTRDMWFDEFKKKFRWLPHYNDVI
uniref:Uncharacterized protein isoform X1 n=2 Tax=Nicotiana tabacum TaxID=4097 RepID=A0A1S4A2R5_TOBAC|nr:PREDICTED: uncharacterized protein LOC107793134 isoform X1 [Nicotiana tabacum]